MAGDSRRICGAANPFALAEARAGQKLNWSDEESIKAVERLLDMPFERIVDPKFGSPIYAGVPLDFSRSRCAPHVEPTMELRDLVEQTPNARRLIEMGLLSDSALKSEPANIRQLSTDTTEFLLKELKTGRPRCDRPAGPREAQRAAEYATADRLQRLACAEMVPVGTELGRLDRDFVIIQPDWVRIFASDLSFAVAGEYFVDAPTAIAPVQGGLGDCWLIAAMSSVAWTESSRVSERIRRDNITGNVDAGDADFRFDLIGFLTIPMWGLSIPIPYVFEQWVGEQVPQSNGNYFYARSSVQGETWPAIMEKAFAVWLSGGNPDFPYSSDYAHLGGGDGPSALRVLIGGSPWYNWADADDTWSTIQSQCASGRTTSPLVAWTWGSSDDSPNKVDYGGAHLVANHYYSILGTWETNNRQYVVLRNPWGCYEGTLNTYAGAWGTPEVWGIAMTNIPGNGVFALEVHTFREYFMGFGGAA